jgi:FtsH-binding integral membrane protein
VAGKPSLLQALLANQINFFLLIAATLGLVIGISWGINKISAATATGLFLIYSALNGVLFSTIFLVYTGESIAKVFFITAGTFGVMSFYGFVTKTDLTRIGQLCFMALIGLILATVVNMFFRSPGLSYLLSYVGVAIFVGLTAYDTQKLKRIATQVSEGSEAFAKASIIGALTLYLDFINLFLMLLRIFGRRR